MDIHDFEKLAALIDDLAAGKTSLADFRAGSVRFGVYPQRSGDRFFVRLRIPYGNLSPAHIRAVADASENAGAPEVHFTTRQGIEVHNLELKSVIPLLEQVAAAGISSRNTGGNAIRGILVCPHATGVDPVPFAEALADSFVFHPEFQTLPRKMKIAFAGCEEDCVASNFQDLGFQPRRDANGAFGFRVVVGGGTGALPRIAQELIDFIPAAELLRTAEAFLRVFDAHGDRQNRRRARVKFLVGTLGIERFRELVLAEMQNLRSGAYTGPLPAVADCEATGEEPGEDAEFREWIRQTVQFEEDSRFASVRLQFHAGNIVLGDFRSLAGLAERLQFSTRITTTQGLLLRGVNRAALRDVFETTRRTAALTLSGDVTACPGSSTCSNAYTNARALGEVLVKRASAAGAALTGLRVNVSGCSNGCGMHATACIGFEGMAQKAGEQQLPAYRVWVGGDRNQRNPKIATTIGLIPARKAPEFLDELVELIAHERRGVESVRDLVERIGVEPFKALADRYRSLFANGGSELKRDLGEETEFRAIEKGSGGIC